MKFRSTQVPINGKFIEHTSVFANSISSHKNEVTSLKIQELVIQENKFSTKLVKKQQNKYSIFLKSISSEAFLRINEVYSTAKYPVIKIQNIIPKI